MKVAVIGGGLTGLSTAYYLQKSSSAEVHIYEKGKDIGGLAGTFPIDGTYLEKYYHHIFTHDMYLMSMIKDLGLEDTLIWRNSSIGFFSDGAIYPFTTAFDLLKFKPLSFLSRIRFGLSSLFISMYKNVSKLETITTEEFMVKIVGKQGWEKIWKPMLRIKFGDNYNKIPAVWIWERSVQRFRSRSGGAQNEVLGYMKGSFRTLSQSLLKGINQKGGKLFPDSDVSEIIIDGSTCTGIMVNGKKVAYDYVICTTALPVFVDLSKNAPSDYIEPLKQVKYDCTLGVAMTLDKPLSNIYWMNISDSAIPFGGLIEHTNLIPREEYGGKTILYFSKYLGVDDTLLKAKDEEIVETYLKCLKRVYPDFDKKTVTGYHIFKDRYAQPIWPMKYSLIKPEYRTPLKGLYMANTSQIYPNDRGMNFSIKLGKEVVEAITSHENLS